MVSPVRFSLSTGATQYIMNYDFEPGVNGSSTNRIQTVNNNGNTITYTYDLNDNIETITQNGNTIRYYYNELDEVIREDNQELGKTITYSYDIGGNFQNKKEYNYTTDLIPTNPLKTYSFVYDTVWKDKMTSFDGKNITYDQIGNLLTYDGWTYTWQKGRQLATMSKTGKSLSFKYNDAGIRTEKTVDGVTTKYHLVGDRVTYQDDGTDKIYFTYDTDDNLISMNLNGTEYYYIRNGQNDIIGLFDSTGAPVVTYAYDTWGKLINITGSLASTVGLKNPYRYRGYRYDTETGMYYLQSRYYNPEWGRFVNADSTEVFSKLTNTHDDLLDVNLFAYSLNNPVNLEDPDGDIAVPIVVPVVVVVVVAYVAIKAALQAGVGAYYAHRNNARPSTKEQHEKGEARQQKDQKKTEKGDTRRLDNGPDYKIPKVQKNGKK